MRQDMPIGTKIYTNFWDRHQAQFLGKIPKPTNIYKSFNSTLRIFPFNANGDGPAFWIFPGFNDKG